jgi:cytochrome oxidase assembly protein ShyY1
VQIPRTIGDKWSERCAFTAEESISTSVGGPPACPFWAPNNHLSFAINWFKPGQTEVIMYAPHERKALKP